MFKQARINEELRKEIRQLRYDLIDARHQDFSNHSKLQVYYSSPNQYGTVEGHSVKVVDAVNAILGHLNLTLHDQERKVVLVSKESKNG